MASRPEIITSFSPPPAPRPGSPSTARPSNNARAYSHSGTPSTPRPTHAAKRAPSISSPLDIKPRTSAARRLSLSATPQGGSAVLRGSVGERVARNAAAYVSLGLSGVLLGTTVLSLLLDTALDTSSHLSSPSPSSPLPISPFPHTLPAFASRTSPFNLYLVKLAWLHTTLIYLAHLLTSPPSRTPRITRFTLWGGATLVWLGFTSWFFGMGVGDRIIALTGGSCALPIPSGLSDHAMDALRGEAGVDVMRSPLSGDLYLSLPSSFCTPRKPLSPSVLPVLAHLLPASSLQPTELHTPLVPRWHKGHDISGHSFLLPLSALLLTRELAPSLLALLSPPRRKEQSRASEIAHRTGGNDPRRPWWVRGVHLASVVAGVAIVGVWTFMLGITGVYFHNPQEKISGLVLGLSAFWTLSFLLPPSPRPAASTPTSSKHLPPVMEEDENAARRGEVVDDGEVFATDVDGVLNLGGGGASGGGGMMSPIRGIGGKGKEKAE